MKNFLQIAAGVNPSQLLLELQLNPQLWNAHGQRLQGESPHSESDDIWARYNDYRPFEAAGSYADFNSEHESVWYPAAYTLPSLRPMVYDLARRVESERIGGVLLWRLRPGCSIKTHSDSGWHVDHYEKFNNCLQAGPGCAFIWDDPASGEAECLEERAGDVHHFRNSTPHRVINNSADDYIVLVVCLRPHSYARRVP